MLPSLVESKVEQYLKKNCCAPEARSHASAACESATAASTGAVLDFSATTTALALPRSSPASGMPMVCTAGIPCLTSVLARSVAPVKSSAMAPNSTGIRKPLNQPARAALE